MSPCFIRILGHMAWQVQGEVEGEQQHQQRSVGFRRWNFPALMLTWKVAPALATGNALVVKVCMQPPPSPGCVRVCVDRSCIERLSLL